MNIIVKKAAMRNSLFLNYEFEQRDVDVNNTIKTQSDAPIHEDLQHAFKRLIPHFAFIAEEIDEKLAKKAIEDPETYLFTLLEEAPEPKIHNYHVHEFSIVDKKGLNFVSFAGTKTLASKDVIAFSTPSIDLDSINDYKFVQELSELIDVLKQEILEYMDGKQAPRKQLEMWSENEEEEHEEKTEKASKNVGAFEEHEQD